MNPFHTIVNNLSIEFILKTLVPIVLPYFVIRLYRFKANQKILKSKPLKDKVVIITGASSGLGKG